MRLPGRWLPATGDDKEARLKVLDEGAEARLKVLEEVTEAKLKVLKEGAEARMKVLEEVTEARLGVLEEGGGGSSAGRGVMRVGMEGGLKVVEGGDVKVEASWCRQPQMEWQS